MKYTAQPGRLRRPLRGLKDNETKQSREVRSSWSDSSQQASSKLGAVHDPVDRDHAASAEQ